MFYGFYGSRIFGRSTGFWPVSLLALIAMLSFYDEGRGLRSIFYSTWHGIPVIVLISLALGGVAWLSRHLESQTRRDKAQELAASEAQFVSANRPGGWKQYYGLEETQPEPLVVPDAIRRNGWQPSYGPHGDLLARTAEQHRQEQQRLQRHRAHHALLDERREAERSSRET
jgi:hypothetical protein